MFKIYLKRISAESFTGSTSLSAAVLRIACWIGSEALFIFLALMSSQALNAGPGRGWAGNPSKLLNFFFSRKFSFLNWFRLVDWSFKFLLKSWLSLSSLTSSLFFCSIWAVASCSFAYKSAISLEYSLSGLLATSPLPQTDSPAKLSCSDPG